ncbi:hypothetical protein [Ancylobacter sp. IITR112]|uniref:DUF6916 family protein n=1 Tax=Ancylobacter sp. IITR112 TaxID=3138073 RepID=UPI003529E50A
MLTYDAAKSAEGTPFTLELDAGRSLPLVLARVERHQQRDTARPGESFSLILKGTPGTLCPQGTYALTNIALGTMNVFIVPIGDDRDSGEFIYQAIFS